SAKALGFLLVQKIQAVWYINSPLPQLIVPIPLHCARLRERGFNQALEIAKPIARSFNLPIDKTPQRTKYTQAQSGLSAQARKQNVDYAFSFSRMYTGLSIAVIDDVVTTGHTVREFCKTLKQNGAEHITIWCCARRA